MILVVAGTGDTPSFVPININRKARVRGEQNYILRHQHITHAGTRARLMVCSQFCSAFCTAVEILILHLKSLCLLYDVYFYFCSEMALHYILSNFVGKTKIHTTP